jgi:lipoate-protein ligase A
MTALEEYDCRLIREERRPGPMQMALDEIAAETASKSGLCTLRVYRWTPSTLSLGYHQDPETVDWAYCEREGIDITRRQTGGGGIYHDQYGDISYSIIVPADAVPGRLLSSYELLCVPILDAFERMGVDASFAEAEKPALHQPTCYLRAVNPAHDILAGGQKISGNAQYRQKDAVIQHGSLSYDRTVDRHLSVFADPSVSADEFRRRVTSIRNQSDTDREAAVDHLEAAFSAWVGAPEGSWTADELDRALELAARKYETDAWNREREAPAHG